MKNDEHEDFMDLDTCMSCARKHVRFAKKTFTDGPGSAKFAKVFLCSYAR